MYFFKTKKVVGFFKMDKNICPKTDFAKKNLAKKSTIFILKHSQAKSRKNNFNSHCDVFYPIFRFVLLGGIFTKTSSFRRKINQNVLLFLQNLPKCPPPPFGSVPFPFLFPLYYMCIYYRRRP
jgi:hypothetical protein